LSEDKLYSENLTVKETLTNSLMLISMIKYKRFTHLDPTTSVTAETLANQRSLVDFVHAKTQSILEEL
jgi:hypothetical protein